MAWALEKLVQEYEAMLSSQQSIEETLKEIAGNIEAVNTALQVAPESLRQEVAHLLRSVKDYTAASNYDKAREASLTACQRVLRVLAHSITGSTLDVEECPSPQSMGLLVAVVRAGGPLTPIVYSLLSAGAERAGDLINNAERIATRWESISKQLVQVYEAARRLESKEIAKVHDIVMLVARLVGSDSLDTSLAHLETVTSRLTEIAQLLDTLTSSLADLSEALQMCRERMGPEAPYCRWLSQVLTSVISAYDAAETLREANDLEELGLVAANVRKAYEKLSNMQRLIEKLSSRIAAAAGISQAPLSLAESIEVAAIGREQLGLTRIEEELLIDLVERDVIDLIEVYERGEQYLQAALRLCRRGIAQCSIRAY
ncbi:hypothetical protein Pyrde_0032 [Pyrodictium delaneyi]|uniref:Uncharacterized protein n=1 Tax=Pyrodictium delaneyi TaxID=1273541 RepID=A0A0P0N1M0_9CREN|nr:hypothetical protein [Pyrodictium delaneyi]ALL00082.1 hypothetical protein Pyrde_0032 [Pyrodictium delaneyi]